MKQTLIKNIRELLGTHSSDEILIGKGLSNRSGVENAWILIHGDSISDFGSMDTCPKGIDDTINADGRLVFPAFIDSHTHLVFAESREKEFVQKIDGASYAEIAASGGGILNSAKKLQDCSEDELFERSLRRAYQIMQWGTGSVEIKSGYGLTVKDEIKMLRVARRIGEESPLKVKTTFLGAHAFPKNISRSDYISQVKNEMIPRVAEEKLADYIDVFCEDGFFSLEESVDILEEGKRYGLIPKVHANQLNLSGGVQAGVQTKAISVDHLETVSNAELDLLEESNVIATLLPGAAFFLRMSYPPAREMISRGLPVSVASDFNPGSSPMGNMQTLWSLACIGMKMTPVEALNAMTMNASFAMEVNKLTGSIQKGKAADLIITKPISSLEYIPYSIGEDCIERVILDGKVVR